MTDSDRAPQRSVHPEREDVERGHDAMATLANALVALTARVDDMQETVNLVYKTVLALRNELQRDRDERAVASIVDTEARRMRSERPTEGDLSQHLREPPSEPPKAK
jgi:hypothetical protein